MTDTPSKGLSKQRMVVIAGQLGPNESLGRNRRAIASLRSELETELWNGRSLRSLFLELRDNGLVRSDYSAFFRTARILGLGTRPPVPVQPAAVAAATVPLSSAAVVDQPALQPESKKEGYQFKRPSAEPREFVHNPNPIRNRKDLFK